MKDCLFDAITKAIEERGELELKLLIANQKCDALIAAYKHELEERKGHKVIILQNYEGKPIEVVNDYDGTYTKALMEEMLNNEKIINQ